MTKDDRECEFNVTIFVERDLYGGETSRVYVAVGLDTEAPSLTELRRLVAAIYG